MNTKLIVPFLFLISLISFYSCEQDDNFVGYKLLGGDKSTVSKYDLDVVAYTKSSDTIRSDEYALANNAIIGKYNDPIFGKTTANFYTQLALSTLAPTFGTNPIVDSVVLNMPLHTKTRPAPVTSTDNVASLDTNITKTRATTSYVVDSLYGYGTPASNMNIQIHEITEDMGDVTSTYYSDKSFATGQLLGEGTMTNKVTTYENKSKNLTTNITTIDNNSSEYLAGFRIKLNNTFFQNKILNSGGATGLSTQELFRKYINGLRISTNSADGYLCSLSTGLSYITIYYKSGVGTVLTSSKYNIYIGGGSTMVRSQQYIRDRSTANTDFISQLANPNTTTGSSKVFVQGMGGAKTMIKLNPTQINAVKDSVANKGWRIVNASLKLYVDGLSTTTNSVNPNYINIYNADAPAVINDYTKFTKSEVSPIHNFNTNPSYYELTITNHLKRIVEKGDANTTLAIEMGDFREYLTVTLPLLSTRVYNTYGIVFVGNNDTTSKKMKLEITYTKK